MSDNQNVAQATEQSFISRTSGLKTKDYIGYAMGDTACCLVFGLVTSLLQKFYTDIFHLQPLFIMLMFIGARIWDAINDPIMGRICDSIKLSRWGRYRPWFLWASIPLVASSILMFVKWPGLTYDVNPIGTCIYATVTYVMFGMSYTMLQIPYGGLASVVTTDEKERTKLSVFRSIGAGIGGTPVILIASFAYAKRVADDTWTGATEIKDGVKYAVGENGKILTDMQYLPVIIGVVVLSLACLVMLLLAFAFNKERVVATPKPKQKGEAKGIIKNLFTNRAFLAVSVASMLLLAGQMFTQSFYLYLFDDLFGANWMNIVSTICTYAPMAIFMFLTPKMVRKFGKKEICGVGMIVAAAANLCMFALRGVDLNIRMYLFLVLCFVSGCGMTFIVLQVWSMATDAIDDIEVKTGRRDDGTAYAFFMFFRKIGQVIAAVAVNGALLGMHYNTEKGARQTLENLNTMYDLATIIPAVLFGLMAVVLLVWYPLSKKKVAQLQVEKEAHLKKQFENNAIAIDNTQGIENLGESCAQVEEEAERETESDELNVLAQNGEMSSSEQGAREEAEIAQNADSGADNEE